MAAGCMMSDTKGGRCPAHAAYGLAVALALALGFAAGWLAQAAYAPPAEALPENFAARLSSIQDDCAVMRHRQQQLLRKLLPDVDGTQDR